MKNKWFHFPETTNTIEHYSSKAGKVVRSGVEGWDAFVTLPNTNPARVAPHILPPATIDHKVGECYTSHVTAQQAVMRYRRKYAPLASQEVA